MSIKVGEIIKKYNLRLTKNLGQNFLCDQSVVNKIVDAADVSKNDLVIEIGPGIGSMTIELAKRAGLVVAVEIDSRLIPPLTENLKEFNNIHILNSDILKIDIESEIIKKYFAGREGFNEESIKVVANLPYYITTPIIMKFFEKGVPVNQMVFMVQKEVADRITAMPGRKDYGALSVAVQYYSRPKKMFNVSSGCFIPRPDVESTIISLDVNDKPPVKLYDKETFFKVVKAAFGQRRKTLLNALSNSSFFNESKIEIRQMLVDIDINPECRGETLSIMQFSQLSNSFSEKDC